MTAEAHHRMFHWRRDVSLPGLLGSALAVAVISTLLTLIIPGLVASHGNVFYKEDMVPRLKGFPKDKLAKFTTEQRKQETLRELLDRRIEESIRHGATDPAIAVLCQTRDQIAAGVAKATPPIAVIPFYLNPQMLLWPAIYTCLCWIALIFTPASDLSFRRVITSRKTIELAILTYMFYEWPLWMRNFVLSQEGRVVYAYPNVDIHPASFAAQECVVFGFCLLLAVIWRQWAIYLARVRHDDPIGKPGAEHLALLTDPAAAAAFADVFFRWATCSVLLAVGFIGLTAFYWDLVGKFHDQRYLLSAILAHVLWGITWIVLSQPLMNEWRLWGRCRTYAYQVLAQARDTEAAARTAALIKEIQPVNASTLTLANATSVASFALPIIQAFIK